MRSTAARSIVALRAPWAPDVMAAALVSRVRPAAMTHAPASEARRRRRIFYGLRTAQQTKGAPIRGLFRALIAEGGFCRGAGAEAAGEAHRLRPAKGRRREADGRTPGASPAACRLPPTDSAIRTKTKSVRIGHPETGLRFASKASRIFAGTATSPLGVNRSSTAPFPVCLRTGSDDQPADKAGKNRRLRESLTPAAEGKRGLSTEPETSSLG